MTSLDERIKAALDAEDAELMESLEARDGVFRMMANSFSGSMRGWMILVYGYSLAFLGLAIWTGIEFWQAAGVDERIFWGVWFLTAVLGLSLLKLWVWMDMHRQTTSQEIKRLELLVARHLEKK